MGIVVRNAERMGLHRDGTILKLPPWEVERRRRLWWQLQHLDLAIAATAGSTPLTMMADWDTRLPLNIEDDDINPSMGAFPTERTALTSMSYCLWRFWVVQEQRSFRRMDGSRYGFTWLSNRSLSYSTKEALISQLEDGLKQKYLQYCDPIKPLDIMILITARALINAFRRWTVYPLVHTGEASRDNHEYRNKLFDLSMKSLEYDVAIRTTETIRGFRWHTRSYFQWSVRKCPSSPHYSRF